MENIRMEYMNRKYETIRVLGAQYTLLTSAITRTEIEHAGAARLDEMERTANMEIDIACTFGYPDAADAMCETLKQIRAQRAMNDARASILNGCMCGVI